MIKKSIAVTYDDSPNEKTSMRLLDILKKYDAKATFMMQGNQISGNEEAIKRMLKEGHQLGNHTYSHPHLPEKSFDEIQMEVNDTINAVEQVTGVKPHVVRPPYGEMNDCVKEAIDYPLILWTIDSADWDHNTTEGIIQRVKDNAFDGAIILLHDSYETTLEATDIFVPYLQQQGYTLVTLDEMMKQHNVTMQSHVPYFCTDTNKTTF